MDVDGRGGGGGIVEGAGAAMTEGSPLTVLDPPPRIEDCDGVDIAVPGRVICAVYALLTPPGGSMVWVAFCPP